MFTKRLSAIVLAVLMALPLFIVAASAEDPITYQADAINDARGAGALVIYTPEYGATTNTNEWGYEAIVENNRVVRLNNCNSAIPENGFVISGHNNKVNDANSKDMGVWIKENIQVGDYVYYNQAKIVTVSDVEMPENSFYTLTLGYHGKNVTRGENMVIIYDKPGTKTGTNEWGYEVTVTGGIVTKLGGYDSAIPDVDGSFVVSVHGADNVAWVQANVELGMSVTYDSKEISFAFDDNAALRGLEMILSSVQADYDAALKRYDNFDYEAAKKGIADLKAKYEQVKKDYKAEKISVSELLGKTDEFEAAASEVSLLICESKPVEYRGVWIRPTETSKSAVERKVQELYDNGINMICIETLYDSTMIMPMPEGCLFECNPKFDHFDMLAAYIEECHEREMELHLWLPIFYVGDYYGSNMKRSVGAKKPEWLLKSQNGKYSYQVLEKGAEGAGLMMLDPSNEEACNYLLSVHKYILETYDVDGIQLDYIRYYTRSGDGTSYDMGYNEGTVAAFKEKYGVTPKYDMKASYWNNWVNFRCQFVTNYVERMRNLVDEVAPDVLIGADVAPDPAEAKGYNYQDYYTWLSKGWIDILNPMSYGYGYESQIAEQIKKCGDKSYIGVGLGIFMGELTAEDMQIQAVYNNSVGADGSVYFEASSYLKKKTGERLLKSVYRNKAMTPSWNILEAAKIQIEFAKERINNIILPLGGVTEEGAKAVIAELDALAASFTEDSYDKTIIENLPMLMIKSKMNTEAAARITQDVTLAVKGYNVLGKSVDTGDVPDIPNVDIGDTDNVGGNSGNKDESDTTSDDVSDTSDASDISNTSGTYSASDEDKSGNTVMVVCIVIVVIAVIAGVAVVIIKKKRG